MDPTEICTATLDWKKWLCTLLTSGQSSTQRHPAVCRCGLGCRFPGQVFVRGYGAHRPSDRRCHRQIGEGELQGFGHVWKREESETDIADKEEGLPSRCLHGLRGQQHQSQGRREGHRWAPFCEWDILLITLVKVHIIHSALYFHIFYLIIFNILSLLLTVLIQYHNHHDGIILISFQPIPSPQGRQGEVKHMFRGFVFIYSIKHTEHSGYFVCRSKHLTLAGGSRVVVCWFNLKCY